MGAHRASRESRVRRAPQVTQAERGCRVTMAALGHQAHQDPPVPLGPSARRGLWAPLARQDLLDIRYYLH